LFFAADDARKVENLVFLDCSVGNPLDELLVSRDDEEGHWPPIPDHWAAYGAAETVEFPERGSPPLTDDELSYARDQAELFGAQARWLAHYHGPWGGIVRGGYEPRGGWYGVVGEALTGWWLTARADPRLADLRAPLAERATCIAGLTIEEQSGAEDAADAASPERVEGAWFTDGETRMDDQQHAASLRHEGGDAVQFSFVDQRSGGIRGRAEEQAPGTCAPRAAHHVERGEPQQGARGVVFDVG
jgi:hypothetical protein